MSAVYYRNGQTGSGNQLFFKGKGQPHVTLFSPLMAMKSWHSGGKTMAMQASHCGTATAGRGHKDTHPSQLHKGRHSAVPVYVKKLC